MVITWQQLKEARKASGLTQSALAELVQVHPKTIVNWEANRVPRKSEYRVERVLGEFLKSDNADKSDAQAANRATRGEPQTAAQVVHLPHAVDTLDLSKENIALLNERLFNAALATELRLELAKTRISISVASNATEIKPGFLRKLLGGDRRITFLELWLICAALGIDPQRIERQALRSAIQHTQEEAHKKALHEARLVKHAEEYL
jgi:transcriptional regulator with XRE-family HTH domain